MLRMTFTSGRVRKGSPINVLEQWTFCANNGPWGFDCGTGEDFAF